MSDNSADLKYAASHEWVCVEEDGTVTVGISDHAQSLLGDVVFIELPEIDSDFTIGSEVGVVESVKAASDIYAPLSGSVIAVNDTLSDAPELVNTDPHGAGWLYKLNPSDISELDSLLDFSAYAKHCASDA